MKRVEVSENVFYFCFCYKELRHTYSDYVDNTETPRTVIGQCGLRVCFFSYKFEEDNMKQVKCSVISSFMVTHF